MKKYKPWKGLSILALSFIGAMTSRVYGVDGQSAALGFTVCLFAVLIWATGNN